MKERLIAEILTCIKKAMIIALIGMLFPISGSILLIGLGLWIYIPMYDRYMKEVKENEKESKRKKKDND